MTRSTRPDMKSTSLLTILLASLSVAGCRGNGAFEPLERENRQLEDRVYLLEYELEKLCDLYDDCLAKNQVLTEQVEGGDVRPRQQQAPPSRPGQPDTDLGDPATESDPDIDLGAPEADQPSE